MSDQLGHYASLSGDSQTDFIYFGSGLYRTWVPVKRIVLTFRMNESPAMSSL